MIEDGKVLAARRVHGGELGGLWEFPGGKLEEGETDTDALVREFDEEFGVRLEPLYLLGETSFFHHGRKRALAAWVCRLGADRAFRLSEHLEVRWLPCEGLEALDLVDSDRKLLPLVRDCLDGSRDASVRKT